tara:strand:+ start:83 stop:556 length:474 start_codon:yes stop_codon:yes gene_type:complete
MTDGTNIQHKQARKYYLERIADLQKKYPNVPLEVIKDSIRSGNNPSQHFKKLKAGLIRKNIAKGAVKGAKFVAGKSLLPVAALQFLQGSPVGAESDVVSDADKKHIKELRASQIHSGEYADAFPQRKKRGGKVKKKKKKTRSKPNKIMQGYKAGGKV